MGREVLAALAIFAAGACVIVVTSPPRCASRPPGPISERTIARICTAEKAVAVDRVVTAVTGSRMMVRSSLWASASPSLREDLAAWVSACRVDGNPVYVFDSESATMFGTYSRERGYEPAPIR